MPILLSNMLEIKFLRRKFDILIFFEKIFVDFIAVKNANCVSFIRLIKSKNFHEIPELSLEIKRTSKVEEVMKV